jgi:hypothetical protein
MQKPSWADCLPSTSMALFHGVPHHFHLYHLPWFTSLGPNLPGLHVYSRIAGGGVKYGRPVLIFRKEDDSLYRFFHWLAAASSLDVSIGCQLIVLFVGAPPLVPDDHLGNIL